MFKRALVSVSDKSGLVEFLKPYYQKGMQIVSTGGTAKFLEENGFIIEQVSKLTQFPEVMGGRVKTLHPNIHMALLYRGKETSDLQLLKEKNIIPFDLLVVNLYPFEKALVQNPSFPELVEQVDIGGPSLLRGAAKNYERLTVLCNPDDYSWVSQLSEVTEQDRKTLAAKVFALTASYDSLIAKSFGDQAETTLTISGRKVSDLRYGENPHQTANWFAHLGPNNGLSSAKIIQGKPLSYNNLLDLDAAAHLCSQVQGPCSVIVKHNNPCGVAVGSNLIASFKKALAADPVSAFGE